MSEVSMRHTVKRHVVEEMVNAHWQRLEDGSSLGIPDINFCWQGVECWIEAKQMDLEKLPKREATPVRIGLRPEQSLWLEERKRAGGHAYVLAKIGQEWLLWDDGFRELRDGMTIAELRFRAVGSSYREFQLAMIPCYRVMLSHETRRSTPAPSPRRTAGGMR
jgi:hypothetical protein